VHGQGHGDNRRIGRQALLLGEPSSTDVIAVLLLGTHTRPPPSRAVWVVNRVFGFAPATRFAATPRGGLSALQRRSIVQEPIVHHTATVRWCSFVAAAAAACVLWGCAQGSVPLPL